MYINHKLSFCWLQQKSTYTLWCLSWDWTIPVQCHPPDFPSLFVVGDHHTAISSPQLHPVGLQRPRAWISRSGNGTLLLVQVLQNWISWARRLALYQTLSPQVKKAGWAQGPCKTWCNHVNYVLRRLSLKCQRITKWWSGNETNQERIDRPHPWGGRACSHWTIL